MIELTHATQQALARIATAPATSDQAQRSVLAKVALPLKSLPPETAND